MRKVAWVRYCMVAGDFVLTPVSLLMIMISSMSPHFQVRHHCSRLKTRSPYLHPPGCDRCALSIAVCYYFQPFLKLSTRTVYSSSAQQSSIRSLLHRLAAHLPFWRLRFGGRRQNLWLLLIHAIMMPHTHQYRAFVHSSLIGNEENCNEL